MIGLSSVAPDGDDWIPRKLRDLEREILQLQAATSAAAADASAALFAATVLPTITTEASYTLPVQSASFQTWLDMPVPVPAGFTRALVLVEGDLTGFRSSSAATSLTIQLAVDAVTQDSLVVSFPASTTPGTAQQSLFTTLTTLGASIDVTLFGHGSAGWDANTGAAHLQAAITFLR